MLRGILGTGGSAPVGGSGTPDTIPRWATGTTLGNSALTQDAAGTGVGLNVPAASVSPNTLNLGASRYILIGDPQTKIGDDGFIQSGTASGNSLISYFVSKSLFIRRGAGTTPVMTFDASSNVGIGTASPGFPLEVVGATQTNNDGIRNVIIRSTATAAALAGGGIGFGGFYDGTALFINDFAGIQGFKENATAGNWAGALRFTTRINGGSPTERMRIDSSGNVGIGTASPSFWSGKLAVSGGDLAMAAAARIRLWGTTGTGLSWLQGTDSNELLFLRAAGATESMRITSTGNVHAASGTTTMTDGFFYIPAAAGAPTGTPTAIAGRVPMYYDTTNNEFYVYNTAWKKVALL